MTDEVNTGVAQFDAEHQKSWATLPWYVNGTLAAVDSHLVDDHLKRCLVCRREMENLRVLAIRIGAPFAEPQCEDALRRLNTRIDAGIQPAWTIPWAAAAVLVLVGGLVAMLSFNTETSVAWLRNAGYSMLSQTRIDATASQTTLAHLDFYDDITERQLRSLLLAVGADVIEGPTAQGVYTIAFNGATGQRDVMQALSKLRHSRRVVFAEPAMVTKVSDAGDW